MTKRQLTGIFLSICTVVSCWGCSAILEGDAAKKIATSGRSKYEADRKIRVFAEPDDLGLYRKLLPSQFAMPKHPLVCMVVVDYTRVGPWPLTPYLEGYILLRASYRGEEGWHAIFMPVTKWVALWGGRTLGYPKYIADTITLAPDGSGWRGEIVHEGASRLLLVFTPGEVKEQPVYVKKKWDLGGPSFQLRPPAKGPAVQVIRWPEQGKPDIKTTYGLVTVTLGAPEPFAGLVRVGSKLPGAFITRTGGGIRIQAD